MGKVIIGGISFKKNKGYDKRVKKNYRELTTNIKDNLKFVYREYNENIILQDKSIRAIVDILKDNVSIESFYLQKSQSIDNVKSLFNEVVNNYK